MSFKKQFAADLEATKNGKELFIGKTSKDEPITFTVASMDNGNLEYQRARDNMNRNLAEKYENPSDAPLEVQKEEQLKIVCKHVIKGWSNVKDDEGNNIPFTEEAVYEMLSDPALYRVYDKVLAAALDNSRFDKKAMDKALGN